MDCARAITQTEPRTWCWDITYLPLSRMERTVLGQLADDSVNGYNPDDCFVDFLRSDESRLPCKYYGS